MKYAFTIYGDESQRESATPEESRRCRQAYGAVTQEMQEKGVLVAGEGLYPTATATTVRVRDGERDVTDGPFAETKEQLGRLLRPRLQGPRRGDRVGGQDPGLAVRLGRDPAGDGLRRGRQPGRGSDCVATPELVDRLFRHESGRAIASLIRVLGDFDLAEDAVQEAFVVAMQVWPERGIPDNPGAWITTTARNKAIDRLRRERRGTEKRAGAGGARAARRHRGRRARGSPIDCRRPPATDLHLLPSGAGAGGAGRAHAPHARRPGDPGDRPRLPRLGADDGAAAGARQAQDQDGEHPLRGAGGPRPAGPAQLGAHLALSDLQRGLLGDLGRGAGPPRAQRRGDPAGGDPGAADAGRVRGARAAGADAPPGLPPRGAGRARTASWSCWRTRTARSGIAGRSTPGSACWSAPPGSGPPGPYVLQAAIAGEHARADEPRRRPTGRGSRRSTGCSRWRSPRR